MAKAGAVFTDPDQSGWDREYVSAASWFDIGLLSEQLSLSGGAVDFQQWAETTGAVADLTVVPGSAEVLR